MRLQELNQEDGAVFPGDFALEGEDEFDKEVEDEDVEGDDGEEAILVDLLAGVAAGLFTEALALLAGVGLLVAEAETVFEADLVTDRVGVRDLALTGVFGAEVSETAFLVGDGLLFLADFLTDLGVFPFGVEAAFLRPGVLAGVLAILRSLRLKKRR